MIQIHKTHQYKVQRDEDTSLTVTARAMSAADHRAWEGLLMGNEFIRSTFQVSQAQVEARQAGAAVPAAVDKFRELAAARGETLEQYMAKMMEDRVSWYETALSLVSALLVSWEDVLDQHGEPVPSPKTPNEWREIIDRDPFGEWFVIQLLTLMMVRAKSAAGNGRGGSRNTASEPPSQSSSAGDGPSPPAAPGGA